MKCLIKIIRNILKLFFGSKSTFPLENQIDCVIEQRLRLAVDHLIRCIDFFLHDRIQPCHGFIGE